MIKEKFVEYLKIQGSGVTNMFNVKAVISLSGGFLMKADILDIMQNYGKYVELFGVDVKSVKE